VILLMGCLQSTMSLFLHFFIILCNDVCSVGEDDTILTADIKCRVLDYLDDKYSDPLCRQLLSVAFFLDLRFLADYVRSDVGRQVLIVGW